MLSYCLLILCLNLDALSYGIAYGSKQTKLKQSFIWSVSILSTIFFSISLYVSKYMFQYLNEQTCRIINGIILIILGISYIIPKKEKEKTHHKNISFGKFFLECFAISVDAIFTALLSGFSQKYFLFFIIFYFLTNFLAIFCGNLFFYKLGHKLTISIDFLSCFIFVFLGIFKFIGF